MSEALASGGAARWLVLGAGGHARSLVDVIERRGDAVVGVCGEARGPAWSVPVLGSEEELAETAVRTGSLVALGIGDNTRRLELLRWAESAGLRVPALVARTATVASTASLGPGVVVLEHAHVGPYATLGRAVVVNTMAVVEHDAVVGDGSHVGPGATILGAARVGPGTLIGAGVRLLPGVRVGAGAVAGTGAVVTADVADGGTVTGMPARPLEASR